MKNKSGCFLGLVSLFFIAIFAVLLLFIVKDKYTDGRIPAKDEDRYLLYINERVFTKAFDNDNTWLNMVNSSKEYIQLCSADTAQFKTFFIGKESLIHQTKEQFPDYDFAWGIDEDLGMYFSLPRNSKLSNDSTMKNKRDYVVVPVWLVTKLIDENLLDMNAEIE